MLWTGVTNTQRGLGTNYFRQPFGSTSDFALARWVYDNAWTYENADNAKLPRLSFEQRTFNTSFESRVWRVDASYIRLKNIEFNYTINKIPGISGLRNLTLYASGTNLLTFSRYVGNDPEASGNVGYPLVKIFNFGLRAQF